MSAKHNAQIDISIRPIVVDGEDGWEVTVISSAERTDGYEVRRESSRSFEHIDTAFEAVKAVMSRAIELAKLPERDETFDIEE